MTYPARHLVRWLLLCALGGLSLSALATGCSSSGYSPNCPPLKLYDVRADGSPSPEIVGLQKAAALKGCYTLAGDASSGTAGSTGSGGSPAVDAGGG